MSYKLYTTILGVVVFFVWISIAFFAVREYLRVLKKPGMSLFMSRQDIAAIKNPQTREAIKKWKRLIRKLFLIWIITAILTITISIIISRTIGFTE